MRELIMTILITLIQLIILVGLGYFIDFLKTKTSTEKLKKYYDLIVKFVHAAEQTFGDGKGALKKQYVINTVKKILGNKLTDEEIDRMIESAVFEMNLVLKEKGLKQ